MSWPTNDEQQPWRGGPVDQPPTTGGPPIPPYAPPQSSPYGSPPQPGPWGTPAQPGVWGAPQQPGAWGPQDTVPGSPHLPPHQPQLRYALWGERVGATLIDVLVVTAVTVLLAIVTFGLLDDSSGLVGLAAVGWIAWLNGSKGQSPGKAIMGLKLVRDGDGRTLGGPVGLVRALLLWVLGVFSIGIFWLLAVIWPFWDEKKQALHDKMFGAVVTAGHQQAKFGKGLFTP